VSVVDADAGTGPAGRTGPAGAPAVPRRHAPRRRALRVVGERVAIRVEPRVAVVAALAALAALAACVVLVTYGNYPLSAWGALETVVGRGVVEDEFIINDVRVPRAILAVLVGACLGLSGSVFQTLSRNPLGSPDIIGFTHGCATGALVAILLFDVGTRGIGVASVVGGFVAAAIVVALSTGGGLGDYRLVLVGIGVASLLQAVNAYLITRAELSRAQFAASWLAGQLNGRGWEWVGPVAVAAVVLLVPLVLLAPYLRILELGDDTAAALGVRLGPIRVALVAVGVGFTAIATAAAGPVAFVAM